MPTCTNRRFSQSPTPDNSVDLPYPTGAMLSPETFQSAAMSNMMLMVCGLSPPHAADLLGWTKTLTLASDEPKTFDLMVSGGPPKLCPTVAQPLSSAGAATGLRVARCAKCAA